MKKKLFIISLIAIFFVCIFPFSFTSVSAAEKTEEEKVNEELENIYLPEVAVIDFPVPYVSAYGSTIKWESSNSELLNVPENGGWVSVTRPEVDTQVTLTVTITNGNASGEKSFKITVLKGVTHTNTYNITYVLNSGTNNPNNPSTYKVGTTVELLAPTKGRVEFLGWYDNAEFVGEEITSLPEGLSGDYTLYAKWAVEGDIKYTKICDLDYAGWLYQEADMSALPAGVDYQFMGLRLVRQNSFLSQTGEFYVDALRVKHEPVSTGLESVTEDQRTETKFIENGYLHILLNGVKYNVLGAHVE